MLGCWREELELRYRWDRVALGKAHFAELREIELGEGEAYRGGMEGSEERAEVTAKTSIFPTNPLSITGNSRAL